MQKIAAALVKAQREFGPALKTSNNPHFRSKYADLSACVEAVIDGLNNNGIALLQPTHQCDSGVMVETLFVHESGETLSAGKLHVPASKQDAQGYGSALTYARRYSLMAACGIAPEDDDGNAASRRQPPQQAQAQDATPEELTAARDAAMQGTDALKAFWEKQTPDIRKRLAQHMPGLKQAAATASKGAQQ
ncbi:MAG: hypothetical protein RL758_17 [Pseudomonadota bacterium]